MKAVANKSGPNMAGATHRRRASVRAWSLSDAEPLLWWAFAGMRRPYPSSIEEDALPSAI